MHPSHISLESNLGESIKILSRTNLHTTIRALGYIFRSIKKRIRKREGFNRTSQAAVEEGEIHPNQARSIRGGLLVSYVY